MDLVTVDKTGLINLSNQVVDPLRNMGLNDTLKYYATKDELRNVRDDHSNTLILLAAAIVMTLCISLYYLKRVDKKINKKTKELEEKIKTVENKGEKQNDEQKQTQDSRSRSDVGNNATEEIKH